MPDDTAPDQRPLHFNVIGNYLTTRKEWQDLARRAEDLGFRTLLVPDHLGFPAALARLVSAADATTRLRVGTRVLNNDFHHPLRLAQDAATIDVLTDGRLELGLGSGWAQPEYERMGIAFEPAARRAARLGGSIALMRLEWESIEPSPVQKPGPPVMIGGQHDAILAVAAHHADIVGFTGARLSGGQLHPHCVAPAELAERVAFLRAAAGERFARMELGLRALAVMPGGDVDAIARALSSASGVPPEVVVDSPFAFVGSMSQLEDKLHRTRAELGITTYDVPDTSLDDMAPLVARLTS